MFEYHEIDPGPIRPGSEWNIRLQTDSEPILITVDCYRRIPGSARTRRCRKLRTIRWISADQRYSFLAPPSLRAGHILVTVTDSEGDQYSFRLDILEDGSATDYIDLDQLSWYERVLDFGSRFGRG